MGRGLKIDDIEPLTHAMSSSLPTALVWLRRDLRLHDHAALSHALTHFKRVIIGFVFDTTILDSLPRRDRRVNFIWQSLREIKQELRAHGSDLVVAHGDPCAEIPRLARLWEVDTVLCNHDYEPTAIQRDSTVSQSLLGLGIGFESFKDQVIFERDEVLTQQGKMYSIFTPYKRAWLAKLTEVNLASYQIDLSSTHLARLSEQEFPSIEGMGFESMNIDFLQAGMEGGSRLFEDFVGRMQDYKVARDFPAIKGVSYLSTHLRFGTVSVRELARTAYQMGGIGAETWLSELIWREFYHQILWHRPEVVEHSFKPEYDTLAFPNQKDWFEAWCEGKTGYPIVDAAMRQLNQTGFMHNRLRMIAASFLVKDCLVDWRWGERYFALHLNDFDLAANNGGWQWAASTGCDAQPYFRIFNPVTQSERFDPEGKFIRRYCPELAALGNKYIHSPWLADESKLCGLRLGTDYPSPILDHATQRQAALTLYRRD